MILSSPAAAQMPSRSGLPIAGNGLRHTFKTLHVELGIPDMLSHFLMGHALEGVSAKYIAELIIANGPALREAQEKISARVFELLGLTLGGNLDAPLVPTMPSPRKSKSRRSSQRRLNRAGEGGLCSAFTPGCASFNLHHQQEGSMPEIKMKIGDCSWAGRNTFHFRKLLLFLCALIASRTMA